MFGASSNSGGGGAAVATDESETSMLVKNNDDNDNHPPVIQGDNNNDGNNKKMLIQEASLQADVEAGHYLMDLLEQIQTQDLPTGSYVESQDYFIHDSYTDSNNNNNHDNEQPNFHHDLHMARITFRIPSDDFDATRLKIRHRLQTMPIDNDNDDNPSNIVPAVRITREESHVVDRTGDYVDVATRAQVIFTARQVLYDLLQDRKQDETTTVEDILNIQRELNRLTEQYESYQSRVNRLATQTVRIFRQKRNELMTPTMVSSSRHIVIDHNYTLIIAITANTVLEYIALGIK